MNENIRVYLGVGQTGGKKNDMFRINAATDSKVAQFISEHFGTNDIEIGQKLWLRRHFSWRGVRFLRFTRHRAWNYGFCINSINNKDILVLFVVIPMYFRSGKWNMTKNMVATPSRAANQAKSKMAAILSENCNNSHEICTNWHRMVVLVSKCRFINSRNDINTTKNLYVKYLIAKSKMAAILSEKSKYSHEIWINWPRMVV